MRYIGHRTIVVSMREPTYFILLALHAEPLHGYAIASKVAELSDGRVSPTAGTLYGALDRLVAEGHLEVDREEKVSGRKRRYYRITESGQAATQAEALRMRQALDAATPLIGKLPVNGAKA